MWKTTLVLVLTFYSVWNKVSFFVSLCIQAWLAFPQASRDSPVSVSHLSEVLGLQIRPWMPSFRWILGVQALKFANWVLYTLNHLISHILQHSLPVWGLLAFPGGVFLFVWFVFCVTCSLINFFGGSERSCWSSSVLGSLKGGGGLYVPQLELELSPRDPEGMTRVPNLFIHLFSL